MAQFRGNNWSCNKQKTIDDFSTSHQQMTGTIMLLMEIKQNHMVKKEPQISPAEFKVLEILWKTSPLSASQIFDRLKEETWQSRTVKTLISRLVNKQIISYKEDGNRYLYFPLLKKNDYQKATTCGFIKRIFGGKISPMVAYFSKQEKISKEDIKELKAILKKLESDD